MTALTHADFSAFFEDIHGHAPFPWQQRLASQVAERGAWPPLALPTGSGKTAAIDVAVFHLALEADRGPRRRAPMRIAFVVDRRLVVDDAFTRAGIIAKRLREATGGIAARVAERLKRLSGADSPPLIARRLRGGIPREEDWARSPAQPTILCSTVDQIGSRLLFRGYGLSDGAKPIHAGLIGADCLILLDEAHLANPFRQTLERVERYRTVPRPEGGPDGRPGDTLSPWMVTTLTATPRKETGGTGIFELDDDDRANPILAARLTASKPVRLIAPAKGKAEAVETGSGPDDDAPETGTADENRRIAAIVEETRNAVAALRSRGIPRPAVAVVVNRVNRARRVFEHLAAAPDDDLHPVLMIGPTRAPDRDAVVAELDPLRTKLRQADETRSLDRTTIVVATQCLEAGADLDFDGLVTEAAPLDALRQRFGRLNRAGRPIAPYGAILAGKAELSSRYDDPVYGRSIKAAWDHLASLPSLDFGPAAFEKQLERHPPSRDCSSPGTDAPVLMPAHLALLSQTAPIPFADPEVALYLHGPRRQPDAVSVIWRADVAPNLQDDETLRRLLLLVPPRSAEAIELPVWTARRWLAGQDAGLDRLADSPADAPDEDPLHRPPAPSSAPPAVPKRVFRWAGSDERSAWIAPAGIRPGDTIVVPAAYGGLDRFGWNPEQPKAGRSPGRSPLPVSDIAAKAAEPFVGRCFALRVAPGLLRIGLPPESGETPEEHIRRETADTDARAARLRDRLATMVEVADWKRVREALAGLDLPAETMAALERLKTAKGRGRNAVHMHWDLYGEDGGGPRGIVFVAPLGLKDAEIEDGGTDGVNATEDDAAGSLPGYALSLAEHSGDVERQAGIFARDAGLSDERVTDLALAGFLHDLGKADSRF
ncbi:type I-G CRISPR-associated helicase/endonuclease Cas3g [Azospirillum agricola]|uniref:type I-G CRISPR-associated helicase/endonuclease Cas3g n=1 Tax=Azospirillum agricola TaxID=1720247 RepID=UPI000A0F15AF|nr:type I-U CRISPR-associated helicase/endonuclease Cas3 [Azospirillum agricola]SMH39069.1 CRISPR-associated endonuclease/helicase Cas3 [Azospirillum lipoferum]